MSEEVKNNQPDDDAGVYVISVAAEISGMHPQTLRQYDKLGLVSPSRTEGRNRRYSLRDIALLRAVQKLVGEGINHAVLSALSNWNLPLQIWLLRLPNFVLKLMHSLSKTHLKV